MKRLPYILWSIVCVSLAYTLLRLVLIGADGQFGIFPDGWQFLDPLPLIGTEGESLWYSACVHALLTAALMLFAVRRSRDAGWRPWVGTLMVLPVVRLFVFTALAVVPSMRHTRLLDVPRTNWLDRMVPVSKLGNAVAAILITLALVLPLGFINVRALETYGLALFIGLPFTLGAVSAYLYNHHRARTWWQSIAIAMLTVTTALAAIFLFAMEGLLCILMAAPIVYSIAVAGALIGHALAQRTPGASTAMTLIALVSPGLMAFESAAPAKEPLFEVITRVEVDAPSQQVWNELVAFSRMEDPDELLFIAGISYPIEARIEGTGVGACRYCWFNTGPFVEPITVWDEPRLLAFDVVGQPPPMSELSIYEHIDAPHVDGFFRSQRGQFKLIVKADGNTLLEGTTWYTHDIWPTWYWRIWSDAILHRIHNRVLDHIKIESERRAG